MVKKIELNKDMSILFLCTGNSCRSQIAEGIARDLFPSSFKIHSAGIEAHGINPNAARVMEDIGIDISSQSSKIIDDNQIDTFDLVITLCGDAKDRCPYINSNKHIHWSLIDPARLVGTNSEVLKGFAKVRDQIFNYITALHKQYT